MKRLLLTSSLVAFALVAILSALQSSSAADLQGGSHTRASLTEFACYNTSGGDCDSTFHEVNGTSTFTYSGTCSPGSECLLGQVSFSGAAVFSNTNYSCYAQQFAKVIYIYQLLMRFVAVNDSTVDIYIHNDTQRTISGSPQFVIAFTCDGK